MALITLLQVTATFVSCTVSNAGKHVNIVQLYLQVVQHCLCKA